MLTDREIRQAVEKYNSPIYIFDIVELRRRIRSIREILGSETEICFAMKANPFLISYMDPLVDKFEVCSPGEYAICRKENIDAGKIVMSGVYKSEKDIEESFIEKFNGIYTIESMDQYRKISDLAIRYHEEIQAVVRVTSGNQFGLDHKGVSQIISESAENKFMDITGLHFFSGTQKKNLDLLRREIEALDSLCDYLDDAYGVKIRNIEYGAGLFYDYFGGGDDNYRDVRRLKEILVDYDKKYHFTIELGRYISASCGQYITKVVDVKCNNGKNYCIVDGGIHHLNYHGQMLGIRVPKVHILRGEHDDGKREKWDVCGALCTVHDLLLKDFETEKLHIGDIFVFDDAGAYSVTEAGYLFLSRDLPQIAVVDGEVELIRRSMSVSDINSRSCG